MEDQAVKEHKLAKLFCIPQRVILALMGFFGIVNAYTCRLCLSLAITKLVIPRNYSEADISSTAVCPKEEDEEASEIIEGGDFDWSQDLQGIILSSFYIGYLVTHLPGGILSEKYGGKWVLNIGLIINGIVTLLTPLFIDLAGAGALITLRILMGAGQGTTFPALSMLLAQWVPATERSKLGALVMGGGQMGTILSNMLSGVLLAHFEWPMVFYFFGLLTTIWCVIFALICYNDPASHPFIKNKEKEYLMVELGTLSRNANLPPVPWGAIFTNVPMLVMISAQIGHDWGLFVMVTDLPKYMNDVMQFSVKSNGFLSSLPFVVMWVSSIIASFISDWVIVKKYVTITNVRKFNTGLAAFGPAVFMVAASYAGCDRVAVVVLFTICMGLMGPYFSGMKLSPLDMSPNYAGTLMAISNGIGSLTGVIAPYTVGLMTPNTTMEEWRGVFWVAFSLLSITAVFYCLWASGEIQPFNEPKPKEEPAK